MSRPLLIVCSSLLVAGCATESASHLSGTPIAGRAAIPVEVLAGEYDVAPIFLKGNAPVWPIQLAHRDILTGTARLSYVITREGRVRDPRVLEASHPQFAAGVAHAMPSWRFTPATKAGAPVEVTAVYAATFHHSDYLKWP